jgi:hypothetical protein
LSTHGLPTNPDPQVPNTVVRARHPRNTNLTPHFQWENAYQKRHFTKNIENGELTEKNGDLALA